MQIICSECNKVYNVDSSKIPPGVTNTKCKACGNSISLRQNTPRKPPAPAPRADMMQITCQYCSRQYKINPEAIPEGVSSTRCKACGHGISLKPKSAAPTKAVKADPAKTGPQKAGTKEITCIYCGKKYSINAAKIPPGVTTTKCKACGRNFPLTAPAGLDFAFKDEISKKAKPLKSPQAPKEEPAPQVPIYQNLEPSKAPMWRKPWVLAAAAGVLIFVLAGYFGATQLFESASRRFEPDQIIGKKSTFQRTEPDVRPSADRAASAAR